MDATALNTLVGVIGIIVGIIGIVTGTVGVICINKSKNINKNVTGDIQQATTINNGANSQEVEEVAKRIAKKQAKKQGKKQLETITRIADVDEFISNNPKYCISLSWEGTFDEYKQLEKNNKIINNAVYYIVDD